MKEISILILCCQKVTSQILMPVRHFGQKSLAVRQEIGHLALDKFLLELQIKQIFRQKNRQFL